VNGDVASCVRRIFIHWGSHDKPYLIHVAWDSTRYTWVKQFEHGRQGKAEAVTRGRVTGIEINTSENVLGGEEKKEGVGIAVGLGDTTENMGRGVGDLRKDRSSEEI